MDEILNSVRLLITSDNHFQRTSDGALWTAHQFAYSYWRRYLEDFDEVLVAARVVDVSAPSCEALRADGDGVAFLPLPDFVGPVQFVRRLPRILALLRDAASRADATIVRLPSGIGVAASAVAEHPFCVEIVGDPHEAFARGAITHPLRPIVHLMMTHLQRTLSRRSAGAAYVTHGTLQARYPSRGPMFSVSDVELPDEAFATAPRTRLLDPRSPVLVSVGTMATRYKGQDNLLRAFALLRRRGIDVRLRLAGGGRHATEWTELARTLGVERHVEFVGNLGGSAAVRPLLDAADLFVLPSRAEGLSRALLEAMARGLPCVATSVGGTPEVLPREVLVPSDDPAAFAERVEWMLGSDERMRRSSEMNLERARDFREERLTEARHTFLRAVAAAARAADGHRASVSWRPQS